jgi:hypothetical protein
MSRPQKIHKPIKGAFNSILASVATGTGKGKQAAEKLARQPIQASESPNPRPKKRP